MKVAVLFIALLCFAHQALGFELLMKWIKEQNESDLKCPDGSYLNIEDLRKSLHFHGVEDKTVHEQLFCLFNIIGVQDNDGMIQQDELRELFEFAYDILVEDYSQKCTIQQETPQVTAVALYKCIMESLPVKLRKMIF